ncbi:MAG TPA: polysaccharide biosynthesis tyrosine autokinase [Clostridiales bacterium]|nr:polysaccharide biosynthesis tyrosine autokinase [Clostridiales bacterium]
MDQAKAYIEYKDFIKILRKRILVIILIVIAILAIAVIYRTQLSKPSYEARVSLIIGSVINNEKTQFQIDNVKETKEYMQTYIMILKTNVVAERTIERLGLNMSVKEFKKHIQAEHTSGTQFMEIKVRWDSPDMAFSVLENITEIFSEEAIRIYPSYSIKTLEMVGPYQYEVLSDSFFYTVSIICGAITALFVVLVIELFDSTIKNEEDIENQLNVPVIGTIPKFRKSDFNIDNIIRDNKYCSLDSFRTIRTYLLYISKKSGIKAIVITSARAQEGKSSTAAMLAIVLAQSGKKTLLMDCDLRSPSLHSIFATPQVGLSNYLSGEESALEDIVYESITANLFVLPAGTNAINPVELISSDAMKNLINSLKEEFDYIILDTPPVGMFTEAQVLSQFTDGYLIVVSSNESEKALARKAVKLLRYAEANIIGALLNKVPDSKLYRKYGYYYG